MNFLRWAPWICSEPEEREIPAWVSWCGGRRADCPSHRL